MKVLIIVLMSSLFTVTASAGAAKYDQVFLSASKSELTPEQATLDSLAGKTVYKCITQETKAGKSGTSISMRNVKKPKADEDIERAIEELKKQKESN